MATTPTKMDIRQSVYRSALNMAGTGANATVDNIIAATDPQLGKLFEDRNVLITDGGLITFTGTQVLFTQNLLLEINSRIAGGSPQIINLGSTTLNVTTNGAMVYAIIDRTLGTATVTDNASTLPAVTNANQEVFLILKRHDSADTVQRIYFRNGTALDAGQTVRLGASGSGAGNANAYTESLKNRLVESTFALVTPYVTSVQTNSLLDPSSTAAYSLIDKTVNFTNIGDTLVTKQLADSNESLNNTNALSEVELQVFWNPSFEDLAATYQVSRNGGNQWQNIAMAQVGNTDLFRGVLTFAEESVNQTLSTLTTTTTNFDFNTTTRQEIGQTFTLTNKSILRQVTLQLNKLGSPSGNFYVQLVADSAGNPSTTPGSILAESAAIPLSSLSVGNNSITVNMPEIYVVAGTYHVVIRTDAAYKASYSSGVTSLQWRGNATASTPYMTIYNGTAWSTATGDQIAYGLLGISIDLRVKITAGTANVKFAALGLFYEQDASGIVTGLKNREVFSFDGGSNTFSFVLTRFTPDPDLLKVYDVNTGQVYTYGAFSLNGQTVTFTSGQFLAPGQTIVLVFDQLAGSSFDNSDRNASLLAANFLGSTDSSIDRSQNGRGIFLRRPDGTLREITIDNNDNIVVYSV